MEEKGFTYVSYFAGHQHSQGASEAGSNRIRLGRVACWGIFVSTMQDRNGALMKTTSTAVFRITQLASYSGMVHLLHRLSEPHQPYRSKLF